MASTFVAELVLDVTVKQSVPCQLRYAVDRDLPDGFLFAPTAMEQKWAIAYRDQAIYMIRSWTAEVKAVGRARRDGDELVVERIDLVDDALRMFGDPVETFDWMIRAHARDDRVPLPVSLEGAAMRRRRSAPSGSVTSLREFTQRSTRPPPFRRRSETRTPITSRTWGTGCRLHKLRYPNFTLGSMGSSTAPRQRAS